MNSLTWIMLGLVVAMLVILFLNGSRQKKATAEAQKMISELKPGDRVKTYIGVYGKIISITETTDGKVCVIETGDKNKSQIELSMQAVAGLDAKQIAVYDENNNLISLNGKPVEKTEPVEAKKEVSAVVEKEEAQKKSTAKTTKAKPSTKSTKKPSSKK